MTTPWDARWHLRAELSRLAVLLGALVRAQRERGRTPAGDVVQGLVIEDGEAEGLVADLVTSWGASPTARASRERGPREAILERARVGRVEGATLPLLAAQGAFSLEPWEYDGLLLALAVELDGRFGRLVAYLNDHVQRTRPTLGLVASLAALEHPAPPTPIELLARPWVRDGLVAVDGEEPAPGLAFSLSRDVAAHLASGRDRVLEGGLQRTLPAPGSFDRLVLHEDARRAVVAWTRSVRGGDPLPLVLVGAPGSGRASVARAALAELGRGVVSAVLTADRWGDTLRVARREVRFAGAVGLLLEVAPDTALDWRVVWNGLDELGVPLVLALPQGVVEAVGREAPREPAVVVLDELGPEARAQLWRALLPPGTDLSEDALDALAGRFRFTPAAVSRAIRRATADATLETDGGRGLTPVALERACREVGAAAMGSLAQRLPQPYVRADLVVPAQVEAELDLAIAWVRHQRRVLDRWGFGRRVAMGRGLTALFTGQPGTGKTMAAQVLSRELGLDIFRVDLSRVVSKYIGETEKHLATLFDEARASGAVLFFDEADALFGKRSEVSDAHDRYANIEIGFLLQRMEAHEGVTVLATNRQQDLDEAFRRRFQVIADFPMPSPSDRLRLWEGMFPAEAERAPDLDLVRLARVFEFSGGEIKNVVMAAAYLAAAEGAVVGMGQIKRAIRRELLKTGKAFDERELRE